MNINFTNHARDQMALRGISPAEVAQVVSDPDITYPDQYGNPCFVRWVAERRIRVVIAHGSESPRVITAIDQT